MYEIWKDFCQAEGWWLFRSRVKVIKLRSGNYEVFLWVHFTIKSMTEGSYSNTKLSLLYMYVRSIHKHFDQLTVLLAGRLQSLNILVLTEVNADEAAYSSFILLRFTHTAYGKNVNGGWIILCINNCVSDRVAASLQHAEIYVAVVHMVDFFYEPRAIYRPPS